MIQYVQERVCLICREVINDKKGYHSTICKCGGDVTRRHNAIRDLLVDECRNGGIAAFKEENGLIPNSSERPADAFIPEWFASKTGCIDVAVTSPCSISNLQTASDTDGAHLNKKFEEKCTKYGSRLDPTTHTFIPFIMDIFGCIHRDSLLFLKNVATLSSANSRLGWETIYKNILANIQFKLAKSVANQILLRGN
jgi:hypothetical protein